MTLLFAGYYYFLPNVMNNKTNLQKNMDGVRNCQKTQVDILSFLNNLSNKSEEQIREFKALIYDFVKANYDYNIHLDTTLLDKNPLEGFKGLRPGK